jgi:hypothetical protein
MIATSAVFARSIGRNSAWAKPLAHLGRRALAGVVDPPLVGHHAGDRLLAAGVGHRGVREDAVEHDIGADELRVPAPGQRGRLRSSQFARGTGVEEDGNRLRFDRHFLPPCLRPPELEGVGQSNASCGKCAPKYSSGVVNISPGGPLRGQLRSRHTTGAFAIIMK